MGLNALEGRRTSSDQEDRQTSLDREDRQTSWDREGRRTSLDREDRQTSWDQEGRRTSSGREGRQTSWPEAATSLEDRRTSSDQEDRLTSSDREDRRTSSDQEDRRLLRTGRTARLSGTRWTRAFWRGLNFFFLIFEHCTTVRAFIVAFLDKSIADFTGKHFLFIFWLLVKVLDFSVLGSEDGEDWDEVESFQCHLCLNRMFKGLLEVIRRVQDTPVVDISHVDFELPAVGLGLRRFNCYTTLSGDSVGRPLRTYGGATLRLVRWQVAGQERQP